MIYLNIFVTERFKHLILLIVELGSYTDNLSFIGCKKRKKKAVKTQYFGQGKIVFGQGKSHGILLLTEGGHPVKTIYSNIKCFIFQLICILAKMVITFNPIGIFSCGYRCCTQENKFCHLNPVFHSTLWTLFKFQTEILNCHSLRVLIYYIVFILTIVYTDLCS